MKGSSGVAVWPAWLLIIIGFLFMFGVAQPTTHGVAALVCFFGALEILSAARLDRRIDRIERGHR
jgi:hypothetical protein